MTSQFRTSFRTLALVALPAFATRGHAQANTFSRSFSLSPFTYQGSVWRKGDDVGNNLNSVFIGPSWDLGSRTVDAYGDLIIPAIDLGVVTTPAVNLGRTGYQIQYGGSGTVGFKVTPYYSGGNIDLTYGGSVTVSGLPKFPKAGDSISLTLKYATAPTSNFATTSPTAGIGMSAQFKASGNASATGWFLGDTLFNGVFVKPFSADQSATLFGLITLDNAHANQIASAVNALNVVNPFPVAPSISIPDLSVTGDTIDAKTGAVSGSTVSTFLTAETSLTSWALSLIPGAKGEISSLLQNGNYPLPGTNAVVGWDFADLYWDMNLGFASSYAVTPTPTLGVDVYSVGADGTESLIASSNSASINFTFPNASRIHVKPRVSVDLNLTSNFGFASTGEIGSTPVEFTLNGSIGSGDNAQTYNLDVNPAHAAYTFDVGNSGYVKTSNVPLGGPAQAFTGLYVARLNTTDLPPYVYPVGSDNTTDSGAPLNIDAYSHDVDQNYYTVTFGPEQGYTFLAGWANTVVDPSVYPAVQGGTDGYFDPISHSLTSQTVLRMQFRADDLKPGHYTLNTRLIPNGGTGKVTTYETPLNINYVKGILDGQFYQNSDPVQTVNRILADGTDKTIEIQAKNLYAETQVVMNGDVVLPRVATADIASAVPGDQQLQFTVPAAVAKRFAGSINTIQLRTPDLSGDGKGFTLSDPQSLFIVAKAPALTRINYQNAANGTLPLAPEDVTFEVDGKDFSQATKLYGTLDINGTATTVPLTTAYLTPTALRATVSAGQMYGIIVYSRAPSLSIFAVTPQANVPADHYNPATTSGGSSASLSVKIARRTPTITRFDPAILVKDGGTQTVKVYGDHLLAAFNGDAPVLAAALQGTVAYPTGTSGVAVPYLLVTYPGDSPLVTTIGKHSVKVAYGDAESRPNSLTTEYAAPTIKTDTAFQVVMKAGGGSLNLTGGLYYDKGTTLSVNGADVPCKAPSQTTLTASLSARVPGASASVKATNPTPGGGDSNSVTVALLEGDPSTIKVVPGPLVYDRATGYYKESFAVTYSGARDVSQGAQIVFGSVPTGVKLVNASGTTGGKPYLSVAPASGQAVNVVAVWSKTASATINPANTVAFPY